jgi:hypothetical protein
MRAPCLLPLVPVLFIASCRPILESEPGPTFHAPLSPRSECVVLGAGDTIAIHGDTICELYYTQTQTSIPWEPVEIARYFQGEALHNGGNLVKIRKYDFTIGHNMTVRATVYHVDDIRRYEKQIEWKPGRKLTLSDFKGPPDRSPAGRPSLHSYSGCDFYLFSRSKFYCYYGWIDPSSPDSLRLLAHEQGNFDLCEIYRRQLDENVLRYENSGASQYKTTDHIFREIYAAYLARQAQYEKETDHGIDSVAQAAWTKRIAADLAVPRMHDPIFFANINYIQKEKDSTVSRLTPMPGKALVFFIRPKNISTPLPARVLYNPFFLLLGAPYAYFFNGNEYVVGIKDTATDPIHPQSFTYLYLEPDRYGFTAVMNKANQHLHEYGRRYRTSPQVNVRLSPGKIYYLKMNEPETWFGFSSPRLELLDEKNGRALIRKCSLADPTDNIELPELSNPLN